MKRSKPVIVGDLLEPMFRELGLLNRFRQYKALEFWEEVVGETIARVTEPDSIEYGRLHVKVKDSSWRNELHFHKHEIMDRLNEKAGETVVKDIILV